VSGGPFGAPRRFGKPPAKPQGLPRCKYCGGLMVVEQISPIRITDPVITRSMPVFLCAKCDGPGVHHDPA
jgi:hypothetical protein